MIAIFVDGKCLGQPSRRYYMMSFYYLTHIRLVLRRIHSRTSTYFAVGYLVNRPVTWFSLDVFIQGSRPGHHIDHSAQMVSMDSSFLATCASSNLLLSEDHLNWLDMRSLPYQGVARACGPQSFMMSHEISPLPWNFQYLSWSSRRGARRWVGLDRWHRAAVWNCKGPCRRCHLSARLLNLQLSVCLNIIQIRWFFEIRQYLPTRA